MDTFDFSIDVYEKNGAKIYTWLYAGDASEYELTGEPTFYLDGKPVDDVPEDVARKLWDRWNGNNAHPYKDSDYIHTVVFPDYAVSPIYELRCPARPYIPKPKYDTDFYRTPQEFFDATGEDTAFSYVCSECGTHFWGRYHSDYTMHEVTCPFCREETDPIFISYGSEKPVKKEATHD